jgi:AraC family transcriptional regulator
MSYSSDRSFAEYHSRIDRAIAYVNCHLAEPLTLEILADAAYFSPFHFHRIFSMLVGETPGDFINRLRLERAANLILAQDRRSLTDIAFLCGFSSSSVFSRSFRRHFGMSASEWSKKCKVKSKNGEEILSTLPYLGSAIHAFPSTLERSTIMKVEIIHRPSYHVAYVTNLGGYDTVKIGAAWEKLCRWAQANGLMNNETVMIGVSYDNPDITPADRCRYYACLTIPSGITPGNGIGTMDISDGKHAVFHFVGTAEEIAGAYRDLYGSWLPQSGYQPTHAPCYEVYHQTPETHPQKRFVMDICMPVQPL